jgi:type II secretory pathway pseudopilin PulG
MQKKSGYTILEVLIFIAVSGFIFVGAMAAIRGRQQEVQFAQAIRDFDSKISDVVNDVITGYYPTNQTVSCSDDCVYIGKALHFGSDGDPRKVRILNMAGKRYKDSSLVPSASLADASPKAVYSTDTNFESPDEIYQLQYGLRVTNIIRPQNTTSTEYGIVAVISDFGVSAVAQSQSANIGGLFGSIFGGSVTDAVGTINVISDDSVRIGSNGYFEKNTDEGIVICLESDIGRKASITFGVRGQTTTRLEIDNYNSGCDEP